MTHLCPRQGVAGFYTAADVPGENRVPGFRPGDFDEVFASKETVYHGQPIGIIVAEDQRTARAAAKLVKVKYQVVACWCDVCSRRLAKARQSLFTARQGHVCYVPPRPLS